MFGKYCGDAIEQAYFVAGGNGQKPALSFFIWMQSDARRNGEVLDAPRDSPLGGGWQAAFLVDGDAKARLHHGDQFAIVLW